LPPLSPVAYPARDLLTDFRQYQLLADAQLQQLTIDRSEELSHVTLRKKHALRPCRVLGEELGEEFPESLHVHGGQDAQLALAGQQIQQGQRAIDIKLPRRKGEPLAAMQHLDAPPPP